MVGRQWRTCAWRGIASAGAAILAVAGLSACGADAALAERLEHLAAQPVGRSVDLSTATPFAWDELAVFGQYFPKKRACKVLALSWWGCFRLPYPRPDDGSPVLAVFLNGGEVVRSVQLPRCGVRLVPRGDPGSRVPAGNRRFTVSSGNLSCAGNERLLVQD